MPATTPRLIILGSSNTDLVMDCNRFPKPGETVAGFQFIQFPGGKGANQAVAAARAGARVTFLGACGDDNFGLAARASLMAEGIDIRHFHTLPGQASGVAVILLGGAERENMIAVSNGANHALPVEAILAIEPEITGCDGVLAQLETSLDGVLALAKLAKQSGKPFWLNPAPAQIIPPELLALVHVLTPNELEAELLTGESEPERAAVALRDLGCGAVVVTLGGKGCYVLDQDGGRYHTAPKVAAVDTVGAGDCFNGWLATGLAKGLSLDQAARQAIFAASYSVTKSGAQSGMPTVSALETWEQTPTLN